MNLFQKNLHWCILFMILFGAIVTWVEKIQNDQDRLIWWGWEDQYYYLFLLGFYLLPIIYFIVYFLLRQFNFIFHTAISLFHLIIVGVDIFSTEHLKIPSVLFFVLNILWSLNNGRQKSDVEDTQILDHNI